MTHELQRLITALLASISTVHLTALTIEQASVLLQLTATAPTASCPGCTVPSSSVHSRYGRHVTDLPCGALAVRIHVIVQTFICRNARCARRIFTERLPAFVAPYARNTTRLITTLRAIGVTLGGNAGAQLAARLRLSTRASTLLRLVRTRRSSPLPPPRPLGWTSGPGGGALALAPSWSISRRIAWWTCYRTARPERRHGSPSIRRSPSSAVIGVTYGRHSSGAPAAVQVVAASIWFRTSARPWKPC